MTVKELITKLEKLNGDLPVIMQKDDAGMDFSPLAGADSENVGYKAKNTYSGHVKYLKLTPELKSRGYTQEDTGNGTPCVVLYPVN